MAFVHIGVFLMAIAFALISIFIAKLLLRMSNVIGTMGRTVGTVESKLDKTIIELEQTIAETYVTASDIEEKSLALNPVLYTVKHIGDSTFLISEDIAQRAERFSTDPSLPGTKPFVRTIQFAEFTSTLFGSWKRGKKIGSDY